MRQRVLIVIAALLVLAFAPAPPPRADSTADLEKMQGAWELVSVERAGKVRLDSAPGAKVVFAGGRYSQYGADRTFVSSPVWVDARARPKRLTLGDKVFGLACIYSLEGDTLRLSFLDGWGQADARERPTGFATTSERYVTMTYRRVKWVPPPARQRMPGRIDLPNGRPRPPQPAVPGIDLPNGRPLLRPLGRT